MRTPSSFGRPPAWPVFPLDPLGAWAAAAAVFLAAVVCMLEADGAARAYPFLAFFAPVVLASWLGGRLPGTAVTAAGAVASWWFLIRIPGVLVWPTAPQVAAISVFVLGGLFTAILVADLARAASSARAAHRSAEAALGAQRALAAQLYHRVASDLQFASAALTLQARQQGGTQAAAALAAAGGRLDAIGRLQRMLIPIGRAGDAGQVLAELSRMQLEALGGTRVVLQVEVAPGLALEPERITLLGTVISEAMANAVKHGIGDDADGTITVRLRKVPSSRLELEVRDSGVGLPDTFALSRVESLGLQIVQSTVQRLAGRLSITSHRGTALRVTFPETADPP